MFRQITNFLRDTVLGTIVDLLIIIAVSLIVLPLLYVGISLVLYYL